MIAFTDDTPTGASGPAGQLRGTYVIGCGLAFYDSVTGEFLASANRLDACPDPPGRHKDPAAGLAASASSRPATHWGAHRAD